MALAANPTHAVLSGPVGVGDVGWPSRARGVTPQIPAALTADPLLDLEERNGFTLLDMDRRSLRVRVLGCPEAYVAPEALAPSPALAFELA